MKISRLFQLGSSLLLSLSALLTFAMPLAHAATSNCTWTDGSSDDKFSTAGNWTCTGTTPGNGDVYNLTFPNTASGFNPVNDTGSLSVGSITFQGHFNGGGYDITPNSPGDTISISGGITDNSTGVLGSNEIDGDINVTANQSFNASSTNGVIIGSTGDTLNISTHTLTLGDIRVRASLAGSGILSVNDSAYPVDTKGVELVADNSSFTGSVTVSQGALFVDDLDGLTSASSITVASGALLKGNGAVSTAVIQSGATIAPGNSPGCLTAGTLTLTGTYEAQVGGTNACADYDQLQVTGSVNVTGSTLQLSFVNGFTPSANDSFTIIDNSGSNPVSGTFTGLPEGSTFDLDGTTFRITYTGGDGNDVVLSVVVAAPAAADTAGSSGSAAPKSPNTGLAALMAHPLETAIITLFSAGCLIMIALRLKPIKS